MKNLTIKITLSVLIILTSLIYGLPHILLASRLGANYTPLTVSGQSRIARDEAFAYAPEVNYILKGNLFLKEVYVAEYKNFPTPFMGESAPALVFAILSRLTGSIENAFIAADFIFPSIVFLLLYIVANMFIKNKLYSAAVAFLTVIARDFIAVIPFPHETFQYLTSAENQNYLLYLSRAFHPQLTLIFLSLSLISLIKMIDKQTLRYASFTGILFGILFYSYVFYWTYFAAFYFAAFAYFLVKKQKDALQLLLLSGFIALLIALPYLNQMRQFYQLSLASDFLTKASLVNVPLPLTLVRYFLIAVLFFFVFRKKDQKFKVFVLFLLAGVFIAPVSKLTIGQDLETFHYLRRALMPFATIAFFCSIYYFLNGKKTLLTLISLAIISVFTVYGFNTQIIASDKIQSAHVKDLNREKVFAWLRTNTPKDSVVGSLDADFESLIPTYTQNKVFFPPSDRTITPAAEGVTRYAILSGILSVNVDSQKKNLDDIISYLFIYQSYDTNRSLDLASSKRIWSEKEIERVSTNWQGELNKFKLDYIVVTPKYRQSINTKSSLLTKTASFGDYEIYKFRSQ